MINKNKNPFKPGAGGNPMYVAGRDKELSIINGIIESLCDIRDNGEDNEEDPEFPIFIIGPRGVGKTVLLNCAKKIATKNNIHVVKAKVEDFAESNVTRLIELISGTDYKSILDEFKVSVPGFKATARNPFKSNDIPSALTKKLNKSPVLFLIDEAHTFNTDHFRVFCNLVQDLQSDKLPLGVIYAGTPGLDNLIFRAKATFITRYENYYLNTIDEKSTKLALAKTAEYSNINFDANAVNYLAKLTDNYPYFIQLIGKIMWDKLAKEKKKIGDIDEAKSISDDFKSARNKFYNKFKREITKLRLKTQTLSIIRLLNVKKNVDQDDITNHLVDNFNISLDEADKIFDLLSNLGVIWEEDNGFEASIPSFFNYFMEKNKSLLNS